MKTLPQGPDSVHSNPTAPEAVRTARDPRPSSAPPEYDPDFDFGGIDDGWTVFRPDDDDTAWWAAQPCEPDGDPEAGHPDAPGATHPEPSGCTDLAWLADEALARACRSRGEDLDGLVSCYLSNAVRALRFHRTTSAAEYARSQRTDLDDFRLPDVGRRATELAAKLDVETAWYLQLDTDAGRLAAWEVNRVADLVERTGSQTVEDYLIDEAAFRAAMEDEVMARC